MELQIIDKNGWSKTVPIRKPINCIGSASTNDICLEADDISPVHLQVLYLTQPHVSCRLTNLSKEVILRTNLEETHLSSYQTTNLRDGVEIQLGEFRLIPKLPLVARYVQTARQIEAATSFPDPVLRPDQTILGQLTIANLGNQDDCQFNVGVTGLPDGCIHIDPIPLMYPGAREEVQVTISHLGSIPESGSHDVIFTLTAPRHYPGEKSAVQQEIFVLPVFKHTLEIIDDLARALPEQPTPSPVQSHDAERVKLQPVKKPSPLPQTTASQPEAGTRVSSLQKPETTQPPSQDLSQMKVVRDQFDSFWEEE